MKKIILLTAITVISIMAADKTFAQFDARNNHNRDANYHADVRSNYVYNNKNYYDNGSQYERHNDVRDIRHDQANVNYDMQRIDQKKAEMRRDIARFAWAAYHQDELELQRLNRNLAGDRNDLAKDCNDLHIDIRVASRF